MTPEHVVEHERGQGVHDRPLEEGGPLKRGLLWAAGLAGSPQWVERSWL